jgi:uncharacterized membrane protein
MIFLLVLVLATLVFLAVFRPFGPSSTRRAARFGMAAAMIFAGVAHWLMPTPFIQHLPEWVPAAEELILITGGIEVALGGALLVRHPWRRWAGLALAAYLIAVFPANVYVAVAGIDVDGQPGGLYPWLRLPLQLLFVAWAVWCTDRQPERRRTASTAVAASAAGANPHAPTRGLE